jgi:hypothetical protein
LVAADPERKITQISSEGKNPWIPTGGVGRGDGGNRPVQASAAKVAGIGRNGRTTAGRI